MRRPDDPWRWYREHPFQTAAIAIVSLVLWAAAILSVFPS